MLPSMFLHTPLSSIQKEVLVLEFKSFFEALKISNDLPPHYSLLELIDFPNGGGALILSTASGAKNISKTAKATILKTKALETLKFYYNLSVYKPLEHFVYFEKLKFNELFLVLNFCAQNNLQVIDIKNQRAHPKNSLLISVDKIDAKFSSVIKKYKGKRLENLSATLRSFFHTTKPV